MIIKMKKFPPFANKQDIEDLFETYGNVKSVVLTPKSAFINMPERERAEIAMANLNGMKWKGWRINVRKYRSTEDTPVCRTRLGMFRLF